MSFFFWNLQEPSLKWDIKSSKWQSVGILVLDSSFVKSIAIVGNTDCCCALLSYRVDSKLVYTIIGKQLNFSTFFLKAYMYLCILHIWKQWMTNTIFLIVSEQLLIFHFYNKYDDSNLHQKLPFQKQLHFLEPIFTNYTIKTLAQSVER